MLLKGEKHCELMSQVAFLKALDLEHKRTERSRRPFGLMLLETADLARGAGGVAEKILRVLSQTIRETDVKGWYRAESVLGVIFTEVDSEMGRSVGQTLLSRVNSALLSVFTVAQINQLRVVFYLFPDDQGLGSNVLDRYVSDPTTNDARPKRFHRALKRLMDIVGSLLALALTSPIFLLIAVAVKLTSKGPIFFRQKRVGLGGQPFTFLKFRSMIMANDSTVHEQFVKQMILDSRKPKQTKDSETVIYKLTNDSRITYVGKLLRKTSLDELPQLLNVFIGDMSLVGPRPPIPYEVDCYEAWHKRRLLNVRPGITGLWQVSGRSRVSFPEMVRLDLRYARTWTLWLDIKILMRTPGAVIGGSGAY
jgi:lipopolysaccharide/colanic/teichoic acid biosynthesis glycosyltransferase